MPVVLPGVSDRRAIAAMFAVPSMTVEEDEVRRGAPIDRFVHAVEPLHRGSGSAFAERIERLDRNSYHRRGWRCSPPLALRLRRCFPEHLFDRLCVTHARKS